MSNTKPNDLIHSFSGNSHSGPNFKGLTKREYFAGLAMQAKVSNGFNDPSMTAEQAVDIADELIKKLNEKC